MSLVRKWALVDFTGNVIAYRYFLLWQEVPGRERRWPNVYLQQHLDPRGLDGSSGMTTIHNHPWGALVFLLKGGYTEWREGRRIKRRAGRGYYIPHTEKHAVIETAPNTWSIFAHWFKKTEWAFSLEPCQVVCQRCEDDYGMCEKAMRTAGLDEIVDAKPNSRQQSWQRVTPEFEKRMARRRRAIEKLAVELKPTSPVEFAKKRGSQ